MGPSLSISISIIFEPMYVHPEVGEHLIGTGSAVLLRSPSTPSLQVGSRRGGMA